MTKHIKQSSKINKGNNFDKVAQRRQRYAYRSRLEQLSRDDM